MKKVLEAIDDAALHSMLDAAEEEKVIAIRDGNIDSDGVPMCTVVADGAWCKRRYKANYDSIGRVGFKTGKVLYYIGVRNRCCSICASCQNAKYTPPSHTCFLDWKKSVTSMEADIITNFILMLVGDGDSSVHRKLLETMPYGPNLMVEKVECKNHLTDLTKNTKFPVTSRNLLNQQIPRFRTAIDKAIKYTAAGNEPQNTRICMLKADVENSPLHIFGDHGHCDVYFYNGKKEGEINHVPELKSCGLLQEIMKIICGSVSRHYRKQTCCRKAHSYALRGQNKTRCSAAVSFNNVGEYMRVIHKTMMRGNSPGEST
ncbi:hypothetical protein PR048_001019, partial [Dryococelus australis]